MAKYSLKKREKKKEKNRQNMNSDSHHFGAGDAIHPVLSIEEFRKETTPHSGWHRRKKYLLCMQNKTLGL